MKYSFEFISGKLQVGRSSPCGIAIWPPIVICMLFIEINSVSITYLYLGESWKWRHFPSSLRRSKAIKLKDYFRTISPPAGPAAFRPFCAITTVGKPRQSRPGQRWGNFDRIIEGLVYEWGLQERQKSQPHFQVFKKVQKILLLLWVSTENGQHFTVLKL